MGAPRRYGPSLGAIDVSLSPDGRTMVVDAAGVEVVDVATLRRQTYLPGLGEDACSGAVHARRPLRDRGQHQGLVADVVDEDVAAGRPGARRPHRRACVIGEPGRPHHRHRELRWHDPAVRRGHAGSRSARPCRRCPTAPSCRCSRPTATTCSPITNIGQAYRWDVRPSARAQHACTVAGRTLTRAEWNDALPGREYAPACTS